MKMIFQQTPVNLSADQEMSETKEDLLEDLKKTRYALEVAYSGFDNVTDPDLIDCYIYQVNAILKRYKFLLEKISLKEENDLLLKDQRQYLFTYGSQIPKQSTKKSIFLVHKREPDACDFLSLMHTAP